MAPPPCWPGPIEQWAELNRIADAQCNADPDHSCGETSASTGTGTVRGSRVCAMHDLLRGTGHASATFFRELVLLRYLAPRLQAEEFDERAWPGDLKLSEIASGARG